MCQNWQTGDTETSYFFSFLLLKAKQTLVVKSFKEAKVKMWNTETYSVLLFGILHYKWLLAAFGWRKNTQKFLTEATFLTGAIKYLKYICTKTIWPVLYKITGWFTKPEEGNWISSSMRVFKQSKFRRLAVQG